MHKSVNISRLLLFISALLVVPASYSQTAEDYILSGNTKLNNEDYKGAITDYTRSIELNPSISEAYLRRGISKFQIEDYTGAIEDFTKAVKLNPDYSSAYLGRGMARSKISDLSGSIEDYNKAIELDTSNIGAYLNRGIAKSILKDYENAIKDYSKTIEIAYDVDPRYADAYYKRGLANIEMEKKNDGCLDLKKAAENGSVQANEAIAEFCLTASQKLKYQFIEAIKINDLSKVKESVQNGADVNGNYVYSEFDSSRFYHPLHLAVDLGFYEIAEFLIEKGADVNAAGIYGYTPLHFAQKPEIARLLIAKGANVNAHDEDGFTPLHVTESTDIVRLLIENSADVNSKDNVGSTPLFGVKTADMALLLIEKGANVNAKNNDGSTPLSFAIDENYPDIARLLIEKGASISNNTGEALFFKAIENNQKEIVLLLIEKGADVNKENEGEFNKTPLEYATTPEMAKLLIEKGADVNAKHLNGQTPLYSVDSVEVARLLIEKGADVNAKDEDGDTPLFEAINRDNINIAQLLIEKGAKVNLKDVSNGVTPLYYVQSTDAALLLSKAGADVNVKDYAGNSPLHKAGGADIAKFLIENGAEINAKNEDGETPLLHALTLHLDVAKVLIEEGADVNAKNKKGKTPLFEAFDNLEIASLLIDNGADVNAKDNDGSTPLFSMSSGNNTDEVILLIKNGADVKVKNNYGVTPLHIAYTIDIDSILIENGADVNAKDIDGDTPLHYASEADIVRFLVGKGADINVVDNNGYTPFTGILIGDPGLEAAASVLLEKGYPIDFKNDKGQTALIMVAKESEEIESVEFLLKHNADEGLKDITGKTALDYATALGKSEFVHLLSTPPFIRALWINGQQAVIDLLKKDTTGISRMDTKGSSLLHYMVTGEYDTLLDFIATRYKNSPLLNVLNREHQTPLLYAIDHFNSRSAIRLIEAGADINTPGCFGETALFMADYRHLKDVTTTLKRKKAISKPATYPAELSLPTGPVADVITSWSISPDGKTLISGDDDNIVTLWDISTGKEVRRFSGHTREITSLDYSPDGRLIISGSNDKTIRLWDIATGKVLLIYNGFVGKANSLRFLPDGYSFITGSDGRFNSWDIIKEIETPITDENASNLPRNCLISSPDIIFSPDRKSIVSEEGSGRLNIYDIASGKELHSFTWHNNYREVYSICFSPDSKFLLSGSSDSTIKLWDIATGKELKTYVAHAQYINSLSFSPDGKSFISADSHGNLDLWDIASGKEIRSFPDQEHLVNSIHFLPNGKSFITSNFYDNALNLWETSTGRMLRSFEGVSKQVFSFDISKNGNKILLGSDQDVKLVDINTAIRLKSLAGHQNWVFSVSFSPDEKTFISGGLDSTLKYWDIETGKVLRTYTGHEDRIFSSCYSPDSKSFISGSWDHTVKLWDIEAGKEIKTFTGHEYRVNCVAFAPDGKSFISGSHDKSIKLWDVTTGSELKTFTGHTDDVWSLAYSPDGKSFISGSGDATVKLWDIASGKELKTLIGHNGAISSLCFSSDGKTILSGSTDKTLKLWDANNGLPLRTFTGHTGTVVGARFHPSGNFIMSFSDDKTLKYWDILSTKEIASLCFIDSIDWVLYTPDKYYTATKNGAKALGWVKGTQIWNFDQWDLQYNRPDIVFSRMPDPDTAMIKLYYKAYQKRLKKMKFSESMFKSGFHTPQIKIESQVQTAQNILELDVAAVDTIYPMDRINVWINDVPVYGINGISLRNEKQNIGVPVKKQLSLALSEGDNKIEVSVLNSAGAESLKQTAFAKNETLSVKKDLYFIAISCADYKDNRYDLKYSVKDGRDMARQFAAAGSDFSNIFIDTLFNKNVTRENVAALKEKLLRSKVDDEVILFASGHGLLDDSLDFYFATYDIDFRHPERRGISFDDFENIMDSIPARKKLFMMDACHSGEVDKDEMGGLTASNAVKTTSDIAFRGNVKEYETRGADVATQPGVTLNNSFELMQELFAGLDKGTGTTVISAAAGKGYALESPQWNNGVFTYSIINGLKNHAADRNKDGTISISELKDYSIKEVQLLTDGQQKPTARRESINYDWKIW